jgi:flagellar export protein FliJ
MSKNKLDSIKSLYRAQEQALGRELQRTVAEREHHSQQHQELNGLLTHYREEHVQATSWTAQQAVRFHRFYRQLASTLTVQGEMTQRLSQAEEVQRSAWRGAYQRRLGIERVIDKQIAEEAQVSKRRERRSPGRPPSDGWSNLNEDA